MGYLTNTDDERSEMLAAIGLDSMDDLFASVPRALRDPAIDLPPALGEQDLVDALDTVAGRNRPLTAYDNFLGAGVYQRYVPALVRATISRPEFYTAYTPYQAEASQGTLQTIFEFQSMICALTGLDVANASLYDGATAAAEAAMLAVGHTARDRVVVAGDVHPEALAVIATFAGGRGITVTTLPERWTVDDFQRGVDTQTAAVIVAQPAFTGRVIDLPPIADVAHASGALAVALVDPLACTLLEAPGVCGFDVAAGDAQQLGIPPQFGGPHVGFMAVREFLMRRIPGRLVGMTADHAGRRAYTLTLQTREQHIRREKATSNICTNHALMALAATAYMAQMGAGGMRAVATLSVQRAHHLARQLCQIPGFTLVDPDATFLWEFLLRTPQPAQQFALALHERGIIAGLPLTQVSTGHDDELLVCCTEMTAPAAIDRYVAAARTVVPAGVRS